MKTNKTLEILGWLPFIFYIFLASFLTMKFVFIFFLNASFTPLFIFQITPLFLLPGMNNLQLLFASLLIVLIGTYFHMTNNRNHLQYSFIPTAVMMAGIGITIATKPVSITYAIHYLLFTLLLITILTDQRKLLLMPEKTTTIETPIILSHKKRVTDGILSIKLRAVPDKGIWWFTSKRNSSRSDHKALACNPLRNEVPKKESLLLTKDNNRQYDDDDELEKLVDLKLKEKNLI